MSIFDEFDFTIGGLPHWFSEGQEVTIEEDEYVVMGCEFHEEPTETTHGDVFPGHWHLNVIRKERYGTPLD